MAYEDYACVRNRRADGVATVTVDHPPIDRAAPTELGIFHVMVESVDAAELPTRDGLLVEARAFNQNLATAAADRRMRWSLARGGPTPAVERDLAAMIDTYEE
jgi:hypothetical protein